MVKTSGDVSFNFLELSPGPIPEGRTEFAIGIGENLAPAEVLSYAVSRQLTQIVQRSAVALPQEIELSKIMLEKGHDFLDYPVSAVLKPGSNCAEQERSLRGFESVFHRRTDKGKIISGLTSYVSSFSKSDVLLYDVCLIADELFTNAVYNGPSVDLENTESGEARQSAAESPVPLKRGVMFAGHNEERLIIGCEDLYGTLNIHRLLNRIYDCYTKGVSSMIREGRGGAGIGSFLVFDAAIGYYVGVDRGRRTVICVTIKLTGGHRRRAEASKNLHFFEFA